MKRLLIWILILPVKVYQLIISPLIPPRCIYYPSCSSYFIKSLKLHGPFKGFLYGVFRILRCSPFYKGGVDPVEDTTTLKQEFSKFRNFSRKEYK